MFKFITVLFSKVANYISKLFKEARPILQKEIPLAIEVVEKLKGFMNSPVLPIITDLIPGQADDAAAALIKSVLPKILKDLNIAQGIADQATDADVLKAGIEQLQSITKDKRKGYFLMIASHLVEALADGKFSWAEIVTLIQTVKNPQVNTQ